MNSDIVTVVRRVVHHQLGVDLAKITSASSFVEDLGADSLQIIDLTLAFEEEFGVEITDAAARGMQTVEDAVRFIETHAAAGAARQCGVLGEDNPGR